MTRRLVYALKLDKNKGGKGLAMPSARAGAASQRSPSVSGIATIPIAKEIEMLNLFRRREDRTAKLVEALQDIHFPRITVAQHEAAKAKIAAEREKFRVFRFEDGTEWRIADGVVRWDDLRAASGYYATIEPYDRFGWPKGHPESPCAAQGTSPGTAETGTGSGA
jgi:hypothetical protein